MDRYEGFAEFVAARRVVLSRIAFLLTGDHDAAQDLVQSALVKLAGHWQRVAGRGDPEAYVRRIMANERTSSRRRRPAVPVAEVPDRPGTDEPGSVASRVSVVTALQRLTPRQRMVIVLRFFADLTELETAAAMNCSIGTVKSQTHDALVRLRQLLPATTFSEV